MVRRMASFKDLKTEWSMLCQECTDCWTRTDLQLAAELGKTLLERNKELENNLKQQQNTIDEQAQEIEYMKKQTAALREVNDSRLRVYEQLEVSIQDLERANHQLALENSSDKKQIKSQGVSIESLEARCEELQKKLDELTAEHETLLRRLQHVSGTADATPPRITAIWKAKVSQDGSIEQVAASPLPLPDKSMDTSIRELATTLANDDEVTELLRQLHETKNQRSREQKRVVELGEQLNSLLQENVNLEEQLNVWRQKAEGMKNLQDEISTLEEVRQGHLCGRCLRGVDNRTHDALSIMLDQEEDDDLSLIDSITTDSHRDSGTPLPQENCVKVEDEAVEDNPYRVLVEKYEALLEVQRHPAPHRKASGPTGTCLSLQEELVMSGDFNSFTNTSLQSELKSNQPVPYDNKVTGGCKLRSICKKPFSGTPTDLSEAESSSSGFSDETSNKATQTDDRTGSLLCSIADGEDCKFSIYDDASPIESRFSKTPEYRHLFREIFEVLKRAAEAKDEGEKLPLLDETHQTSATASRVPHSKTLRENFADAQSEIADDTQSVVSSIVSSVVSEPPYRSQTPVCNQKQTTSQSTKNADASQAKPANTNMSSPNIPANNEGKTNTAAPMRPMLTPVKRQPLEYLSIGVGIRKKSSAKKYSAKKVSPVGANADFRPSTPETVQNTNPKIVQAKANSGGRRKFRVPIFAEQSSDSNPAVWNGNTLNFFPSKQAGAREPTNNGVPKQSNSFVRYVSEHHNTTYEYRPSTASAEVARLKRLEMSYAEALRMPNKPKTTNSNRRH
ncbi:cerebellar degeneration-related protein 2 isoform X2 [Athalia rosae]|uniref:cerebellar degeneration-related protein 2 isoform X2 n=2 Tax=Athalia rosae TaxID=37344 RepID=UPI002034086E|nr:cerebellar degeneration-related protein 2 isoform X2 [Athalia rosae]